MSRQLEFSDRAIGWLTDVLRYQIQELYDDPFGAGSEQEGLDFIHEEMANLREIAEVLKLDFEKIVEEVTTPYEQAEMKIILSHQTWSDKIYEEIDALNDPGSRFT